MLVADRFIESAHDGPTLGDSGLERLLLEPFFSGPIAQAHCLVFKRDHDVKTGVACLLSARGPSTVSRLIIPIVFDALNRMTRGWSGSHVLVKGSKTFPPRITNDNTSIAIQMRRFSVAMATRYHRIPDIIFRRVTLTMCLSSLAGCLRAEAAATSSFTMRQGPRADTGHISARTSAVHKRDTKKLVRVARYGQSVKLRTDRWSFERPDHLKTLAQA